METIRQIAAVALVLALALAAAWWVRSRGAAGALGSLTLRTKSRPRRLESLERLALGPHHSLHLVRMGSSALLIGASPSGCALLHRAELRELDGVDLPFAGGIQ